MKTCQRFPAKSAINWRLHDVSTKIAQAMWKILRNPTRNPQGCLYKSMVIYFGQRSTCFPAEFSSRIYVEFTSHNPTYKMFLWHSMMTSTAGQCPKVITGWRHESELVDSNCPLQNSHFFTPQNHQPGLVLHHPLSVDSEMPPSLQASLGFQTSTNIDITVAIIVDALDLYPVLVHNCSHIVSYGIIYVYIYINNIQ